MWLKWLVEQCATVEIYLFCIVQVINVTPRYAKLRCQKEVSLQA